MGSFRHRGLRLLLPMLLVTSFFSPEAHAVRTRTLLLRSAAYGTVAGAGIGVATYPFAKSVNTIIAGAAVGLVMGLAFGAYQVHERNEEAAMYGLLLRESADPVLASRSSPLSPRRENAVSYELPVFQF